MVSMTTTASPKSVRHLERSTSDKMIAGVAGGLGEHFDIDPVIFRVGFVVGTIMSAGLGLLAYGLLWVVVPRDDGSGAATGSDAGAAPPAMAA